MATQARLESASDVAGVRRCCTRGASLQSRALLRVVMTRSTPVPVGVCEWVGGRGRVRKRPQQTKVLHSACCNYTSTRGQIAATTSLVGFGLSCHVFLSSVACSSLSALLFRHRRSSTECSLLTSRSICPALYAFLKHYTHIIGGGDDRRLRVCRSDAAAHPPVRSCPVFFPL